MNGYSPTQGRRTSPTFFVGAIIAISLVSRIQRSTELRQERIDVDEKARAYIEEAAQRGEIHLVAHEVLREAKPNPERRPAIHVGGR
jgi:hypothetical protein